MPGKSPLDPSEEEEKTNFGKVKRLFVRLCYPIVLLELIVVVALVVWGLLGRATSSKAPAWMSTGRILMGGLEGKSGAENGEPYYATHLKLLNSAGVRASTIHRVTSLHPDLKPPSEWTITAERDGNSRIILIRVTSDDRLASQALLDAAMDAFIATVTNTREDTRKARVAALQDELVRYEQEIKRNQEAVYESRKNMSAEDARTKPLDREVYEAELARAKRILERAQKRLDATYDAIRDLESMKGWDKEAPSIFERATSAQYIGPPDLFWFLRRGQL